MLKNNYNIENKQSIEKDVKVLCDERGIEFLGFLGDWSNGYTYLHLACNIHGDWKTTNLSNFIALGYGCEQCNREKVWEKSRLSDEDFTNSMRQYEEFKNHKFERDFSKRSSQNTFCYWKVYCPICEEDEYSKAGISDPYFSSSTSHLRLGKVPCRCSKSYRWTDKELLYVINKTSDIKGFNVVYIGRNKKGKIVKSSKLEFICKNEHRVSTTVSKFLDETRGCDECRKYFNPRFGYYEDRLSDIDYLYILKFSTYGKVGRSFNYKERIDGFSNKEDTKPNIIGIFKGLHKDIYSLEQDILSIYRKVYVDWTKETVMLADIDKIYEDLKIMENIEEVL